MAKGFMIVKALLGIAAAGNSGAGIALDRSGRRPACRGVGRLARRNERWQCHSAGAFERRSGRQDAALHGRRDARRYYGAVLVAALLGLLAGCASQTAGTEFKAAVPAKPVAPAKPVSPGTEEILKVAAAKPPVAFEGEGWKSLFDGKSLAGWQITEFAARGMVSCESGLVNVNMGDGLSGINWTNDTPKVNYEVALDAMRVDGSDFFCGLTFPVKDSYCSLILGGWGGAVTGLSSIDGEDASENQTTQFMKFESGRWYRVRVRVTDKKIEAWLDQKKIVDLATAGRQISLRFGDIEQSKPLGIATYQTTAALREIKMRRLDMAADNKK